ncbi:Metallo-dependent phosphatase [Ceratobasidium sp. AG-I]|nr:Metallo-dependent phosphatase [Ceratobasidium sp. AG-I]
MRTTVLAALCGATYVTARINTGAPARPLEWGDVNVLHTTDMHGWIVGHPKTQPPEPNYNGTFGDFYSFVNHTRERAKKDGRELLLVDTGDTRIGHGLTDRLLPQTVNGQFASHMYHQIGYDAMVPGNHDLEHGSVVEYIMEKFASQLGNYKYITSNVRRVNYDEPDGGKPKPGQRDKRLFLGSSHRYIKTELGRRVTAYGVVYNMPPSRLAQGKQGALISVTPVKDMIKEKWFKDTLNFKTDVFLVLGHIDAEKPCDTDGWIHIYDAIREKHPLTPIMMFGGHTHRRYCTRFTSPQSNHVWRSMLLQSGRYFNTVGWMSTTLDQNDRNVNLTMTRRYLDNNVQTYRFHAGNLSEDEFHTKQGVGMTDRIYGIDRAEGLSQVFGYLKSDYFLDRKEWTPEEKDPESMFSFYLDAVEHTLVENKDTTNWMFFSNWGIVRGDLYRGEFTLGDVYTVCPDGNAFLSVEVTRGVADKIVPTLQTWKQSNGCELAPIRTSYGRQLFHEEDPRRPQLAYAQSTMEQLVLDEPPSIGLKTLDVCGPEGVNTPDGEGDDVPHTRIPQVNFDEAELPVYFWRESYKTNRIAEDDKVMLIFPSYAGRKVPEALNIITGTKDYNSTSLKTYGGFKQHELLGRYVRKRFNVIPEDYPMPTF